MSPLKWIAAVAIYAMCNGCETAPAPTPRPAFSTTMQVWIGHPISDFFFQTGKAYSAVWEENGGRIYAFEYNLEGFTCNWRFRTDAADVIRSIAVSGNSCK